jgi:hypothetical protein
MLGKQVHICLNIGMPATSRVKYEGKSIYSIDKPAPVTENSLEMLVQNLVFDCVFPGMGRGKVLA